MTNIFKSLTKESEFDRAFRHMNQIQNARLEMRKRRLARAIEENKRLKLEKEKNLNNHLEEDQESLWLKWVKMDMIEEPRLWLLHLRILDLT